MIPRRSLLFSGAGRARLMGRSAITKAVRLAKKSQKVDGSGTEYVPEGPDGGDGADAGLPVEGPGSTEPGGSLGKNSDIGGDIAMLGSLGSPEAPGSGTVKPGGVPPIPEVPPSPPLCDELPFSPVSPNGPEMAPPALKRLKP